jgi:hypothetical protein
MASTTSAASGTNLITDGDFSDPSGTYWALSATSAGTLTIAQHTACVTGGAGTYGAATLGWPPSGGAGVVLSSLHTYTFSYTVYTMTGSLYVDAKVGHTTTPYTADVESLSDLATTTAQTYSHTVTGSSDSSAGIAFTFTLPLTSQTVCFAAVSLVQN